MGWSGTIIEQMPKVRSAPSTFHRVACHPVAGIRDKGYFVLSYWRIETGPARAGIKLRIGTKQLIPTCCAEVNPLLVIVPILVPVWRLCSGLSQDVKLRWCENLLPLIVAQRHLITHWKGADLAAKSRRLSVFRHAEADRQNAQKKQEQTLHFLLAMSYLLSAIKVC
jgi:hypothetical protein